MDVFNRLKKFLVQLVQDDQFRNHLANTPQAEQDTLLEQFGYRFSHQEWELGMLQILDAKERNELEELSEEQLVALAGAGIGKPGGIIHPMYGGGVPIDPPIDLIDPHPTRPPLPTPCHWWKCLPIDDHYPPVQAIYGAPVSGLDTSAQ